MKGKLTKAQNMLVKAMDEEFRRMAQKIADINGTEIKMLLKGEHWNDPERVSRYLLKQATNRKQEEVMDREVVKENIPLNDFMLKVQRIVNDLNQLIELAKELDLDIEVYLEGNEKHIMFPTKERYVASVTQKVT